MSQQELFDNNKGLVYKCVSDLNVPKQLKDDAVQEGMIALWLCSAGYDPYRGFAFSSYAYKYIYNYIKKQMRKNLAIKPNKEFYDMQKEIYRLWEDTSKPMCECIDEVFKDKTDFEKTKFLSVQAGILELNEEICGTNTDNKVVDHLDYQKALQKLKDEQYKVWYIIHEHYILGRAQSVIAKELGIGRIRFKGLLDLGLEILKKELSCNKI